MKRILIILLIFVVGCTKGDIVEESKMSYEKVNLKTEDNINIVSNFYKAESDKGIILLHQLNKDKESWNLLINELKGYNIIAIDLRGHGESDLKWQSLGDDFNDMIKDVKAAKKFLRDKGVNKIIIIGASIGANLAIIANEDTIALSPGLNYRSLNAEEAIKDFDKNLLIIISKNDDYSYESSLKLKELKDLELKVIDGSKHGTNMLPLINKYIVEFLDGILS